MRDGSGAELVIATSGRLEFALLSPFRIWKGMCLAPSWRYSPARCFHE
jgi:hypothetical protein